MFYKEIYPYLREKLRQNTYSDDEIRSFATIILEEYTGLHRSQLLQKHSASLTDIEIQNLENCAESLMQNVPLQYILGNTYFYDLKLKINKNVLIPRPETEELVHKIIDDAQSASKKISKNTSTPKKILDIGTGSGCIALAIKKNMPDAQVFGIDVCGDALDVAKTNAELLDIIVDFSLGDILDDAFVLPYIFDIIVSNPPYILHQEKNEMHENVLKYEPHKALFVINDSDPLIFYKKIVQFADKHLAENGSIYFEINAAQAPQTIDLLQRAGYARSALHYDISNRPRIIIAQK